MFAEAFLPFELMLMTLIGLPIGGTIGFGSGWITSRLFQCAQGRLARFVDVPLGYAGLLGGLMAGTRADHALVGSLLGAALFPFVRVSGRAMLTASRLAETGGPSSASKWKASHLGIRLLSIVNAAVMISEVVRPPHHHSWITVVLMAALWLCASLPLMLGWLLVEAWWMRHSEVPRERTAIRIDAMFCFSWVALFILLFNRVANSGLRSV